MRQKAFFGTTWKTLRSSIGPGRAFSRGERVLVAVSGGPDSVCLADFLSRIAPEFRLRPHLAHIHHGIRGAEADADAHFVEKLAERLGLPFSLAHVDVPREARRSKRSLEDAARLLRYRALGKIATKIGARKVATAHHLDDQAETILLHLLRGTDPKGLSGIAPKRPLLGRITLVRPLLEIRRPEIERYLRQFGLRSRQDRSNADERFLRNWVRRRLLPMMEKKNPRIREHLALIAGAGRNNRRPY